MGYGIFYPPHLHHHTPLLLILSFFCCPVKPVVISLSASPLPYHFNSLKPLDIQFMKALHNKVNIVPVIAKADTLTKKEILNLKKRVCLPDRTLSV